MNKQKAQYSINTAFKTTRSLATKTAKLSKKVENNFSYFIDTGSTRIIIGKPQFNLYVINIA